MSRLPSGAVDERPRAQPKPKSKMGMMIPLLRHLVAHPLLEAERGVSGKILAPRA